MNAANVKLSLFAFGVRAGSKWSNTDILTTAIPPLLTGERIKRTHSRTSISAIVEMVLVGPVVDEHILSAALLPSETREQVVEIHTYTFKGTLDTLFVLFRNGGTALQSFGSSTAFPCIYRTDTVKGLDIWRPISMCPTGRSGIADKMPGHTIHFAASMPIRVLSVFEHNNIFGCVYFCLTARLTSPRQNWIPFPVVSHQSPLSHYGFNQYKPILV
jgi:hypothetical protein